MVSTAVNGGPPASEVPEALPPGNYTLVGWDIDTTGRRLIDDVSLVKTKLTYVLCSFM